jgi:hypothetical protein
MYANYRHRRVIAATLVAIGSLPFVLMATFVASMFVLPSVFRAVFDWFVPAGVDAPDNMALAFTGIARSFVVSGSIGLMMAVFGWWLFRQSAVE